MKTKWIALSSALLCATALLASCNADKKVIGILQFGGFEALEKAKDGFVEAINASPWKDKVSIEIKNPNAVMADNVTMASTLAANSDIVYGIATPSASALKNAVDSLGASTPVLFSAVTNPIGANLLKDMEKPDGNSTGVVDLGPIAKQLEFLKEFDNVDKVASFFTSTEVNSVYQAEIAEDWMDKNGLSHVRSTITNASEIGSAFAAIDDDVDAVFLPTDDTIVNSIGQLKAANDARTKKLIIVGSDTGCISGCTFAMGVDYHRCGEQAGAMAIQLLEGKSVKDIPVESCDQNALFINKTWSDSLGIEIPAKLLSVEGVTIK